MLYTKEFDEETYNYFWNLARTLHIGVMVIDEFDYWENLPKNFSDPWFNTLCHKVIFYNYGLNYT
jgi:hypothetical protein